MAKTISGAKASLRLNGVKIAFAGGVNINEENGLQPIDVLDQLEVAELAEISHVVSFSCSIFKIDGNSVSQLGIRPDNIDDILTQPELTMEVYDRIGDRVLYTMSGVKWSGGSGSINARGVWEGEWNFQGVIGSGM